MNVLLFLLLISNVMASSEEENECIQDAQAFRSLMTEVNEGLSKTQLKAGFYVTSYNLKIDEECKNRMPIKKLENFYRHTMAEGTACLSDLSSISKNSLKNIQCFNKLFQDNSNPPKLLCGGWPFGDQIYAVGSFPGSSKRHPYLWLSPKTYALIDSDPAELKATMFHEMLHNCGYTHSEGVEVTYTCEECCFNKKLGASEKESACRICSGKYENENDPLYVKDLLTWSKPYPNWGRDMRMRVLEGILTSKNPQNLQLILGETKLSEEKKRNLAEIILQRKKEDWMRFEKDHQSDMSDQFRSAVKIIMK